LQPGAPGEFTGYTERELRAIRVWNVRTPSSAGSPYLLNVKSSSMYESLFWEANGSLASQEILDILSCFWINLLLTKNNSSCNKNNQKQNNFFHYLQLHVSA
jgi:hypothetical protein